MSNGIVENEQLSELLESARMECLKLLDSARFTTWRDSHLNGSLTAVSILARPDSSRPKTCRIDVICQSAGQLRVDWERIPLELVETEGNRVLARGVLDSRGRWTFRLNYGAKDQGLRFRDPIVTLDLPVRAFALMGKVQGADDLPPSHTESEQLSIEYTMEGDPPDRTLIITVRALDPALRGGRVRVEVRSKRSGKVHDETIDLQYDEGEKGYLRIREELLGIPEMGDLKIEAHPTTDAM